MADNVTTDELEQALIDLSEALGLSVKEYVEAGFLDLTTYGTDMSAITKRLDSIDTINAEDDIESLAEKVASINTVLSGDDGALQGILDLINVNKEDIAGLKSSISDVQVSVDGVLARTTTNTNDISTLKGSIDGFTTAQTSKNAEIDASLAGVDASISTLNGGVEVDGSVANLVMQEELRAKAALTAAIAGIPETDLTDIESKITSNEDKTVELEGMLVDTTDADGNLVKGVVTKVSDLETSIASEAAARIAELEQTVADMKAYSDARDIKASSMDICAMGNMFRGALGMADKDCSGTTTTDSGDGATL